MRVISCTLPGTAKPPWRFSNANRSTCCCATRSCRAWTVAFEEYYTELDLWLEVHAYPTEEGLAVYFQDISQRKKNEVQLRILERGQRHRGPFRR
jgi:hypothetical protein